MSHDNHETKESFFDKIPRLLFLGIAGALAIKAHMFVGSNESAAILSVLFAAFAWVCWAALYCIDKGVWQ